MIPGVADRDDTFEHHAPTSQEVAEAHAAIRQQCRNLHRYLTHVLPGGDEKREALNRVREAMFWANHAIATRQQVGDDRG